MDLIEEKVERGFKILSRSGKSGFGKPVSSQIDVFSLINPKNIIDQFVCLKVKYPDDEDLDGAAIGLLRLQETYKLPTKQLADGFVGNENVGKELTAHDCFEIGRSAYNQKVLKKK